MVTVVPGQGDGRSNVGIQQLLVPSTFTWHDINSVYINVGGTWRTVSAGYGNVNGTWRLLDLGAPTYTFNFGNPMYAGTNGYVSLDNTNTTYTIASTIGKVLGVLPADLYVNSYKYVAAPSYYIVRFSGRRFSSATADEIQYEVWFPPGQNYCLVWLQAFPSGTYDSTGFYKSGTRYGYYSSSRTTGAVIKVNFNNNSSTLYATGSTWGLGATWGGFIDATTNFTSLDDGYASLNTNGPSNPSSVLNLTVSSVGATGTTVTWSLPTDQGQSAVTSYEWALSPDNGATYGYSTTVTSTTATLPTLSSGTNYRVRVRPYNFYSYVGPWLESSTFSFTAPGLFNFYTYDSSTVPTTPYLSMVQGADTPAWGFYMLFSWADSIPADTTYYNVKMWGPGAGIATSTEASPSGSDVQWTAINLTNGGYGGTATYDDYFSTGATGYCYGRVTAVKTGDRRVTATWTSSSNANSYRVEYTLSNSAANGSYIGYVYGPNPATSYEIKLGSSGTVTVNQVKAYNTTDCTGIFTYGSITVGQNNATTPTDKSSASNLGLGYNTKRYYPSVTVSASTGLTSSGGTINWTSSNQVAYSISGGISVGYTASTSLSKAITGLSASTAYSFTVTVYSSDGHSASSTGTLTTTAAASVPPTPGVPTLTYNPGGNTTASYGYKATWTGVTASPAVDVYYLRASGSSGSTTAKGPFSSTANVLFTLPKTDSTWQVASVAHNSVGNSAASGYSNSA